MNEMVPSKQAFDRLDNAMDAYYQSLDRHDYFEHGRKDRGKLSVFCISNGLEIDDVADELQYGPSQCLLLDFDPNFPLQPDDRDLSKSQRDAITFKVIRRCYKMSTVPPRRPSVSSLSMTEKNRKYGRQRFVPKTSKTSKPQKQRNHRKHGKSRKSRDFQTTSKTRKSSKSDHVQNAGTSYCESRIDGDALHRIDNALAQYYDGMGRCDYFEEVAVNGTSTVLMGKFMRFCTNNGIDAEGVEEEMECAPTDCLLVDFDATFPFPPSDHTANLEVKLEAKPRSVIIFEILKKCYETGTATISTTTSIINREVETLINLESLQSVDSMNSGFVVEDDGKNDAVHIFEKLTRGLNGKHDDHLKSNMISPITGITSVW